MLWFPLLMNARAGSNDKIVKKGEEQQKKSDKLQKPAGNFLRVPLPCSPVALHSCHRVLQGVPPRGRQLYFTFPSAPDPLFKASKALRVATPSGAPRQAPLDRDSKTSVSVSVVLKE